MTALPTRRHEDWRYSDHEAVGELWPVTPAEPLTVGAGESASRSIVVEGATAIHHHSIVVEAGARLSFNVLNLAMRYGRVALDVTLHDGAHFELGGVQIGGGDTTLEIVTVVNHAEPNATSAQTIRSVLGGRATGTYLGKVAVARGAQKSDSTQSVRAMLLDRTATANAKPELEIYADDVKCAHGAAIGELDAQALYYLASRGLPPAEARTLLLQAFVADGFVAGDEREAFEERALQALERLS